MAKVWVLDTETKGTGAEMVPLERVLDETAPRAPQVVRPREKRRPPEEPRPAPRFRVVDVMTREALAEGVDTRATLDLLRDGVRSVVDVTIHVWVPRAERWRRLTQRERKLMWDRREG